eukprot:CAMPEP_0172543386 /NCGR_PEP_ID=MMETSP1067-20121228/13805_1 /TAXON_ID=265564 ORGANISM="Thalassiosira punctigera, Strain Tpunct2005C2" /NCGR_SAMPLE_ID=MMETSP1067 /ASSEMBLY_ACC=CAM_ASM_000444 /LENGTH=338 /DNA_ID=CAMNT_0013329803 /DNA_START=28 /DNA_END=1045 /DNA_ORIENTATION=-
MATLSTAAAHPAAAGDLPPSSSHAAARTTHQESPSSRGCNSGAHRPLHHPCVDEYLPNAKTSNPLACPLGTSFAFRPIETGHLSREARSDEAQSAKFATHAAEKRSPYPRLNKGSHDYEHNYYHHYVPHPHSRQPAYDYRGGRYYTAYSHPTHSTPHMHPPPPPLAEFSTGAPRYVPDLGSSASYDRDEWHQATTPPEVTSWSNAGHGHHVRSEWKMETYSYNEINPSLSDAHYRSAPPPSTGVDPPRRDYSWEGTQNTPASGEEGFTPQLSASKAIDSRKTPTVTPSRPDLAHKPEDDIVTAPPYYALAKSPDVSSYIANAFHPLSCAILHVGAAPA